MTPRLLKKRTEKAGLPPGSVVFVGEKKLETTNLNIIDYDETHFVEKEVNTIEEYLPFKDLPTVTWFNIEGLHRTDVIEKIGRYFNLHPLLLEDVVNTGQRPKIDDYGDYLFTVFKMLQFNEEESTIKSEQVSLILGVNFVISFQEDSGGVFNPVRARARRRGEDGFQRR